MISTILATSEDTFLESFFGPGMALHVREFGANITDVVDDFRINLHRCFGAGSSWGLASEIW
jgi:hypothetical protein